MGDFDLTERLKKLTVQMSMTLSTSLEYLRDMPIEDFLDIVQDVMEIRNEQGNAAI